MSLLMMLFVFKLFFLFVDSCFSSSRSCRALFLHAIVVCGPLSHSTSIGKLLSHPPCFCSMQRRQENSEAQVETGQPRGRLTKPSTKATAIYTLKTTLTSELRQHYEHKSSIKEA
eukprot:4772159-Amphidinium_carterae.1